MYLFAVVIPSHENTLQNFNANTLAAFDKIPSIDDIDMYVFNKELSMSIIENIDNFVYDDNTGTTYILKDITEFGFGE